MSEGLLTKAGAQETPSEYAAIAMVEQFTGEWTQAGPFRDPAVPYLYGKFYGASRIDRIRDGLNREISSRLTDVRRPGSAVYNSNTFPAANSLLGWQSNQNGALNVRVLLDGVDGNVYDATTGQKSTALAKAAGAGAARMVAVNTTLYLGDGVEQKKWLRPGSWQASTTVQPGTLINQGATPGTLYMALGGISLPLVASRVVHAGGDEIHYLWVNPLFVPANFADLVGVNVTFSGLTTDTVLNGQTLPVQNVISSTLGLFTVATSGSGSQPESAETGTGSTGTGTTGGSVPVFTATRLAVTQDSGQQWKSYGTAMENTGLQVPVHSPAFSFLTGGNVADTRFWQPNTFIGVSGSYGYTVLDPNGNIQLASTASGSSFVTGRSYPVWNPNPTGAYLAPTNDNAVVWWNLGPPGTWQASKVNAGLPMPGVCVLDSNNNLQWLSNGGGGTSGATQPTWGTTFGATVTDGGLTWTCLTTEGNGQTLSSATTQYAYSLHAVDGSVSTASPVATIYGGILGNLQTNFNIAGLFNISANIAANLADPQVDQVWIWRTAQGQATLIFEDAIPIDGLSTTFTYGELGIPDTSATGSGQLNALVPAPVASANNPPNPAFVPMAFYLGRLWGALNNTMVYSGGPDTVAGNGNTAFAPLSEVGFIGQPFAAFPIAVQDGGLVVFTSAGIQIILGQGTATDPFYTRPYFASVNVTGYNAVALFNQMFFVMEANQKVSAVAIEYPFNPATGYVEIGFPIGDQFQKVTTGGFNAALFNPAAGFTTWNNQGTSESALYVSDGAGHWFRMAQAAQPETGWIWSPIASLVGGASAVQSIETAPGVYNLLIAPAATTTGPLLMRDTTGTVYEDNGTAYPAWDVKGSIVMCASGEQCEVAHIAAKSAAVGNRPAVSVLLGEITASATRPWTMLELTANDPPLLEASLSYYSDRYKIQGGAPEVCDTLVLKFDYGSQNAPDELQMFSIYGAKHAERKQQ